jgi:aspartokinase-like uncharacterized kinase
MSDRAIHVVKIGGSLLDLPDLLERFQAWRSGQLKDAGLLVVGGGRVADLVRAFHQTHRLEIPVGHDLCVRAMQFNTYLLAAKLTDASIVKSPDQCDTVWNAGKLAVVDPLAWLDYQERELDIAIPRRWSFTSDSIAAHLATCLEAGRLSLLKSTLPDGACDLLRAAELELVDGDFPEAAASVDRVELVNLRDKQMPACELKRA